jgi:flagellar biosynthesis/type III secretory pathway protein FliH
LSETDSAKVEWKLNALLLADRKAKAYAQHPLDRQSATREVFAPWQPRHVVKPQSLSAPVTESFEPVPEPDAHETAVELYTGDPAAEERLRAELGMLQQQLEQVTSSRYQEGLTKGRAEATAALEGELAALKALVQNLESIQIDLGPFIGYVEQLALQLARAVVRQLVLHDEHYYLDLVRQGIGVLGVSQRQEVKLFLNPQDLELVRSAIEAIRPPLVLHGDAGLERGDLRLVSGQTEIEESVAFKLDAAFAELTRRDSEELS